MIQDEQVMPHAQYELIRADASDSREWLQAAPECLLLKKHHIAHAGVMSAKAPFCITRTNPSGTYMMACMEGSGQVLLDGRWETLTSGQACVLPPFVMNRFSCLPSNSWKFCWVRYSDSREQAPIISANTPVMGSYAHAPLHCAILGLIAEVQTNHHPVAMEDWINLVHQYVLQFTQPQHPDQRMVRLWQAVEKNLAHPWTLPAMATLAHVSQEHLRRLCQKHLGRSPLQQLTFLRMQQAQKLLATTNDTIETIARAIGYENPFTFSNSFKTWVGWRPSAHRPLSAHRLGSNTPHSHPLAVRQSFNKGYARSHIEEVK
jgi:AraC-like DNA-binding protein